MASECNFCKKTREILAKKAKEIINYHYQIEKILNMKKKFLYKENLVYNYTKDLLKNDSSKKNGK